MKFLADENIPNDLIHTIRDSGFDVDSVKEKYKSYSDFKLIQIVADANNNYY